MIKDIKKEIENEILKLSEKTLTKGYYEGYFAAIYDSLDIIEKHENKANKSIGKFICRCEKELLIDNIHLY